MDKRKLTLFFLWVVAMGVMYFLVAGRDRTEEVPRVDAAGVAVRLPDRDRAPPAKRVGIATAPVERGAPRVFRADARHSGRSAFRGPAKAVKLWQHATGARIFAQPVVGPDGTIYVGSHDHFFYAVTARGGLKWKRDLHARIYSTAAVDADGNVYVGSDARSLYSFDPRGGTRFRIDDLDGAVDTGLELSPDGATLYFSAGRSVYAITTEGRVRWRFEAGEKIFTTPAVDTDGTLYVGSQDDHVYALDPEGRVRWDYATHNDVDSAPLIGDDGTIYFGSDDHHVYALTRDGDLKWSADVDGFVRGPIGLGLDGLVLAPVFGPRPRLVALDGRTGDLAWYFPVSVADSPNVGIASGPLVDSAGDIYFGAHDHFLYKLAPSGDLRWVFATQGDIDSAPVLAGDGLLYVGSDDGNLYALRSL